MSASQRLPADIAVLERGWLSSNNVVFTKGVTAVVDTGYATHAGQTLELVRKSLGEAPLQLIVNTHMHSDHCGGNSALQDAFPGASTLIPPGEAEAIARWDEDVLSFAATGQLCERFDFDGLLRPGESVTLGESAWEIHSAPGHDPHSVILFEPRDRILISADALWANGFGVVFPELDDVSAFDAVGATLGVIEALRPEIVIPGHGSCLFGAEDVAAALLRARTRLASFVASPQRHASHAMKVLIKFKLLDWQRIELAQLIAWAEAIPYMRRIHSRFFAEIPVRRWLEGLVADLARSQALRQDGAMLYNV